MIFIKLTWCKDSSDIYTNPDKIIEMRPQEDGSTILVYSEKIYTQVKETPIEILDIIRIERGLAKALDKI